MGGNKRIRLISLVFFVCLVAGLVAFKYGEIKKLQFTMETRTAKEGKFATTSAEIFYTGEGRLITHFLKPKDDILITNNKGELKIYDPDKNTVVEMFGYMYSSESTFLAYFFNNKIFDLGLSDMGFKLKDSKRDKDLFITEWQPPLEASGKMGGFEMAHENNKPIYIGRIDKNGKTDTKTYFYNYEKVGGYDFPMAITTITYYNKFRDSIVSKTTFSDFKINEQADGSYFDFKIPDDATKKN